MSSYNRLDSYSDILFQCSLWCVLGYGAIYLGAGCVAAWAAKGERKITRFFVIIGSMIYGMFCGFCASMTTFAIIAGIYTSVSLEMPGWAAVVWGIGLSIAMQLVAIPRRWYVYL